MAMLPVFRFPSLRCNVVSVCALARSVAVFLVDLPDGSRRLYRMCLDTGATSEVAAAKDLKDATLVTNGHGQLLIANPFALFRIWPNGTWPTRCTSADEWNTGLIDG